MTSERWQAGVWPCSQPLLQPACPAPVRSLDSCGCSYTALLTCYRPARMQSIWRIMC